MFACKTPRVNVQFTLHSHVEYYLYISMFAFRTLRANIEFLHSHVELKYFCNMSLQGLCKIEMVDCLSNHYRYCT